MKIIWPLDFTDNTDFNICAIYVIIYTVNVLILMFHLWHKNKTEAMNSYTLRNRKHLKEIKTHPEI